MIGYLILDGSDCPDGVARRTINQMSTWQFLSCHTIDHVRVYLLKNQQPNNYLEETPRFILLSTGTFIYHDLRGNDALRQLGTRLTQGGCVDREYASCHGPYTLIILDKFLNRIDIITDREGLQYCFIYSKNTTMALSSSQLLLASLTDPSLNPGAIRQFIHIGHCLGTTTLFKHIERLRPATRLTRQAGGWHFHPLWTMQVQTPSLPDPLPEIVDKTWAMLDGAVSVAGKVEPGRVVADLTGGTDSRTILSFLLRHQSQLTVTAGGAADHVDIVLSKRIARKLGLAHFLDQQDECPALTDKMMNEAIEIADAHINPLRLLQRLRYLREKSERFTINFGGNGGPLFKDHYWLFEFNRTGLFKEPNWQRIANLSIVNYAVQDDFFAEPNRSILKELALLFWQYSQEISATNNQKLDYVYFRLKCSSFIGSWMTLINYFNDVYHPFLNGDIVQYMMNIDPSARKYNTLQFSLIYRNSPELAWTLTDTGVLAVPPVGKYAPLRMLFVRRYTRSALRKMNTFFLKRQDRTGPVSICPVTEALWDAGYFDLLNYQELAIGAIVSRDRLSSMLDAPAQGSNQTYLMNALAVELFARRVGELRGQPVARL